MSCWRQSSPADYSPAAVWVLGGHEGRTEGLVGFIFLGPTVTVTWRGQADNTNRLWAASHWHWPPKRRANVTNNITYNLELIWHKMFKSLDV